MHEYFDISRCVNLLCFRNYLTFSRYPYKLYANFGVLLNNQ